MSIRRIVAALLFTIAPSLAFAQGALLQYGTVTPGHAAKWLQNGAIGDAGGAAGGPVGTGLTELGVTNDTPQAICTNSGPTTSTYTQLCLGFNGSTPEITVGGTSAATSLTFNINGTTYNIPGSGACATCGTIAVQNANSVAITGGTIAGTGISGATIGTSTLNSPSVVTPAISGGGTLSGTLSGGTLSGVNVTPALGTTTQTLEAISGRITDVRAQGAACNTKVVPGTVASIASGFPNLTVGASVFSSTDVGKIITVPGAGSSGATLVTTISAYVSATQVTLATNASTTLSSATIILTWGTSDSSAINTAASALNAAGGGVLMIPRGATCGYSATINLPAGVSLRGNGHGSSVLAALAPNLTGINLTGNNSGVEGIEIYAGSAGTNTSGSALTYSNGVIQTLVNDFIIQSPFIGIISPSGVVLNTIQNGYIYNPTPSTGEGIQVLGGNNTIITNVFTEGTQSAQPFAAIEIQASAQVVLTNNQGLWTGNGMVIDPGAGQQVTWVFDNQSSYDTGTGTGIVIHPTNGGLVTGVYEIGTWTSTMTGDGVLVTKDISSTIDDIHFVGHRSYGNQAVGMDFEYGARLFVTGGSVCGNSASSTGAYAGIKMGANATFLNVTGTMSGACAGFGVTQDFGIEVDTGANHFTATGNNLYGNSTSPFGIAGPLAIAQISNNEFVDDQIVNVTGGSSFTFPPNPIISLGGTGSFSTILGGWGGRRVLINPSSSFTLATGGNIANSVTSTTHVLIEGYFDGNLWYFH